MSAAAAVILHRSKRPLINYKGNTLAVGSDGIRYLADSGKSKSHVELSYGVGKKFATNQGSSTNINYHDDFTTLSANIDVPLNAYREFIVGSGYSPSACTGGLSIVVVARKLVASISFNSIDYEVEIHDMTLSSFQGVVTATLDMTTGTMKVYVNGKFHAELVDETIIGQTASLNYKFQVGGGGIYGVVERDFYNGRINNVILSQSIWTPTQIQFHYNFPELFLCPDKQLQADGSYKWFPQSEYLNQDDLDSFVVHLAMSEKDDKIRNYIGYSETEIINEPFDNSDNITVGASWVVSGGVATSVVGGGGTDITITHVFDDNTLFLCCVDVSVYTAGTLKILSGFTSVQSIASIGKHYFIFDSSTRDNIRLRSDGDAFDGSVEIITVAQLTSTYEIPNFTDSVNLEAINMNTGSQSCFYEQDERGVIYGSNFKSIAMNGVAVPALAIPMTDTELNGAEGKWVIEFVIAREMILLNTSILSSFDTAELKGFHLYVNRSYADNRIQMYLYDGVSYVKTENYIDENPHHIIFENDGSNLTMIVDGVAGVLMAHSFVPSGLNFADNVVASPIGKLAEPKIWYGDNYYKYNREKSIAKGLIAKESLL